jgi:hypothetical protein
MASQNLFPSIGALAQQADGSEYPCTVDNSTGVIQKEDEDRLVQELESLCMNCEEQVGTHFSSSWMLT